MLLIFLKNIRLLVAGIFLIIVMGCQKEGGDATINRVGVGAHAYQAVLALKDALERSGSPEKNDFGRPCLKPIFLRGRGLCCRPKDCVLTGMAKTSLLIFMWCRYKTAN